MVENVNVKRKKTGRDVKWKHGNFQGADAAALVDEIMGRYEFEFGRGWVVRVWAAMRDWCLDNPEKIGKKRDHRRFVLGWFRRDAAKTRERMDGAIAREARVGAR